MQRNRRITPHNISTDKRVRQRFCAFYYFCGTIPSKAIASHSKGIARGGVINGQVEGHGAVAADGIGERMSSGIGAVVVRGVPPREGVANRCGGVAGVMVDRSGDNEDIVGGVALRLLAAMVGDTGAEVIEGDDDAVGLDKGAEEGEGEREGESQGEVRRKREGVADGIDPEEVGTVAVTVEGDAEGGVEVEVAQVNAGDGEEEAVGGEREAECVGLLRRGVEDCDIGRGDEGVAVGVDERHLTEEGIERLATVRKRGRDIEVGGGEGEILVDVDGGVGPLVPDGASGWPREGDGTAINGDGALRGGASGGGGSASDEDFGMAVGIDVGDDGIFGKGGGRGGEGSAEGVERGAVEDEEGLHVAINHLVLSIEIEIESSEAGGGGRWGAGERGSNGEEAHVAGERGVEGVAEDADMAPGEGDLDGVVAIEVGGEGDGGEEIAVDGGGIVGGGVGYDLRGLTVPDVGVDSLGGGTGCTGVSNGVGDAEDADVEVAIMVEIDDEGLTVGIGDGGEGVGLAEERHGVAGGAGEVGDVDFVDGVAGAILEATIVVDVGEGIHIVGQDGAGGAAMRGTEAFIDRGCMMIEKGAVGGVEDIGAAEEKSVAVAHDVGDGEEEVMADDGGAEPVGAIVTVAMDEASLFEKVDFGLTVAVGIGDGYALTVEIIIGGDNGALEGAGLTVEDKDVATEVGACGA